MMKPRFVRFRMSRYFLQKNHQKILPETKVTTSNFWIIFYFFIRKLLRNFHGGVHSGLIWSQIVEKNTKNMKYHKNNVF